MSVRRDQSRDIQTVIYQELIGRHVDTESTSLDSAYLNTERYVPVVCRSVYSGAGGGCDGRIRSSESQREKDLVK